MSDSLPLHGDMLVVGQRYKWHEGTGPHEGKDGAGAGEKL